MSRPNSPDDLEHPRDAAHWFARMQSGEVTDEDRRAFEAWRNADPRNERQYQHLHYLWQATLALPQSRLRSMMSGQHRPGHPTPPLSRRQFGLWLAGGGALAVAGGAAMITGAWRGPLDAATLITRKGQRRRVPLPDGSTLFLNTDTAAVLRFYATERRIELQHGEAFFEVSPDTARPFVVDAGLGQITVTGTRFNVRRDTGALQVSVVSGSVRVQAGPLWRRSVRNLTANQQTGVVQGQALDEVRHVDADSSRAWTRGKVIFNNAALSHVIDEINRYLDRPVRLDAPQLAKLHLSGVFSVDDPHAMIDALPAIAPVRLDYQPDGRISILPR